MNTIKMKTFILIIVLSCFVRISLAQFTFIPELGLNVLKLQEPENIPGLNYEVKELIGFNVGASLRIGHDFYVQPGILFSQMGNELKILSEIEGHEGEFAGKIKINVVHVPVMLGYRFLNSKKFDIHVQGGGSLSFPINASSDMIEFLNKEKLNDHVWGLVAGLGVDIYFIKIDLTYEYGLSDILQTEIFNSRGNALRLHIGVLLF